MRERNRGRGRYSDVSVSVSVRAYMCVHSSTYALCERATSETPLEIY